MPGKVPVEGQLFPNLVLEALTSRDQGGSPNRNATQATPIDNALIVSLVRRHDTKYNSYPGAS
jgi:hypothetical protein